MWNHALRLEKIGFEPPGFFFDWRQHVAAHSDGLGHERDYKPIEMAARVTLAWSDGINCDNEAEISAKKEN